VDKTPFFRHPLALIANAEEWLNQSLESVLEPQGYRVLAVSTGRQLLERAAAAGPDLILLNAHLPDLDGLQVCQALLQTPALGRHTPIILITSTQATKQQRLAALRVGPWDYLSLVPDAPDRVGGASKAGYALDPGDRDPRAAGGGRAATPGACRVQSRGRLARHAGGAPRSPGARERCAAAGARAGGRHADPRI